MLRSRLAACQMRYHDDENRLSDNIPTTEKGFNAGKVLTHDALTSFELAGYLTR